MYPPLSDNALRGLLDLLAGEDNFVFLETTRANDVDHLSLLFRKPVANLSFRNGDDVDLFFSRIADYQDQGFYLAGWFAYEFGMELDKALAGGKVTGNELLADLGVYEGPHIYDHRRKAFTGAGQWPTNGRRGEAGYRLENLRLNLQQEEYLEAMAAIKRYIEAGDTYQVNYTLKMLFDFEGSVEALYETLRRNQSVGHGAFLRKGAKQILSFSPELFFRKSGDRCTARPMKGTVRRGRTCEEDAAICQWLRNDIKNRSENVMIVDLLRNDLGRVCRMGTIDADSLFDVETYESLHQMTSAIHGSLRPEVGVAELFRALFPCGSVTGAPKIRTMEIIRELEAAPRGVYTGAIGYFAPNGDAVFSVPIRTVALDGNKGEMGIGSGVVYDSDPQGEWEECKLKGRFLTDPRPPFELIETLLRKPGEGYWLLDYHLERLERSAEFFGCPFLRDEAENMLADWPWQDKNSPQRVRLTLAKDGTMTITAADCGLPGAISFAQAAKAGELPAICLCERPTDSQSVYLYHKTTNRDFYNREREQAVAAGCFDAVFINERGELTEGAITNIFVRKDGKIVTPPVTSGLLDGVFRRFLLEGGGGGPVFEEVLTARDLEDAEEIYLGNSVRGLIRVRLAAKD